MNCPTRDQNVYGDPSYNQNPPQFDKALVTRDSPIVCGNPRSGSSDEYNLSLHVGALFIVLFVSSTACAFPLIVVKAPRLRIPPAFLFLVRHFGTGVLIATAFVHLLPTAFVSLTDPCLPPFWNEKYPAMAGAIALAAVFLIAVIEMTFSPGRNMCAYPVAFPAEDVEKSLGAETAPSPTNVEGDACLSAAAVAKEAPPIQSDLELTGYDQFGHLHGRSDSTGRELQRMTEENANLERVDRSEDETTRVETDVHARSLKIDGSFTSSHPPLTAMHNHKKALLQCLLLETGILFHSVFIGMALSVAVGNEFIVLLIAITFHQTFEGLALGSRIASLTWRDQALQPWIMAFAYGCTTPLGQAIGLATHTLYAPDSQTGLLMVGTMNAISSGLLTFTSMVDLLSEDFLTEESWRTLRGKRRVLACLLVFLGAFGMSLIGAWA